MNTKNALGRGLSALLSNVDEQVSELVYLELNLIDPNPDQPRKSFNQEALDELCESIKVNGVLQPILVRKVGERFQIIAGERRYRASRKAELATIPAIVIEADDKKTMEIALLENIQRENLDPIEECETYNLLISKYGYTHETLAAALGKSRSHISNIVRLQFMAKDVKDLLRERKITVGHAKVLLNHAEASTLAKKIVDEGLTVRDTEQFINKSKNRHKRLFRDNAYKVFEKDTDLVEIELQLTESLGMKVEINDTIEGGEVVVKFNNISQLDYIIQRILGQTAKPNN